MPAKRHHFVPMFYQGVPPVQRRKRAMQLAEKVGLEDRTDHRPTQLSGGQQQRVCIARALINEPLILLADEPTGALDSRTSIEIMAIFQALNRERGITLVVVTHEPDIAAYASRVLQFRDGELVSDHRQAAQQATQEAA